MGRVNTDTCKSNSSITSSMTPSTSVTETVTEERDFKKLSYSSSKGIGKYIASDTFNVGGCVALFELTLVDLSRRERHKVHSHFGRALESKPYKLKYRGRIPSDINNSNITETKRFNSLKRKATTYIILTRVVAWNNVLIKSLTLIKWSELGTTFDSAAANVERAIMNALKIQYADVLTPLKDSIPKRLRLFDSDGERIDEGVLSQFEKEVKECIKVMRQMIAEAKELSDNQQNLFIIFRI
ncbi:hypothetical protein Tco_0404511 [Tanacetum coccineum]